MYLTATEEDRLRIFTASQLARRARTDGLKLNAPEATALICDEMHRAALPPLPAGLTGRATRRQPSW